MKSSQMIGRTLHYVVNIDGKLICRPGIVIQVNRAEFLDIQVFGTGTDRIYIAEGSNETKKVQTWHWPRSCEKLK